METTKIIDQLKKEIEKTLNKLNSYLKKMPEAQPAVLVLPENETNEFTYMHNNQHLLEAIQNGLHQQDLTNFFAAQRKQMGTYLLRPDQSIHSMNKKQLRLFTRTMMKQYALLNKRTTPCYNDPDMKPTWWPEMAEWTDSAIDKNNMKALVQIVKACFKHYEVECNNVNSSSPNSSGQNRSSPLPPQTECEENIQQESSTQRHDVIPILEESTNLHDTSEEEVGIDHEIQTQGGQDIHQEHVESHDGETGLTVLANTVTGRGELAKGFTLKMTSQHVNNYKNQDLPILDDLSECLPDMNQSSLLDTKDVNLIHSQNLLRLLNDFHTVNSVLSSQLVNNYENQDLPILGDISECLTDINEPLLLDTKDDNLLQSQNLHRLLNNFHAWQNLEFLQLS